MRINFFRILVLIFMILHFTLFTVPSLSSDGTETNFVILIDESHDQFINSSLLHSMMKNLQELGHTVVFSDSQFSNSTLSGVDLIIIPNPGKFTSSGDKVNFNDETYALDKWLKQGNKGMIILANPLDLDNESLNGHIRPLNNLISTTAFGFNSKTFIPSTTSDEDGVLVKEIESIDSDVLTLNNVKSSLIQVNNSNFVIKTISTSIKVKTNESILSAGYDSFLIGKNGLYASQKEDNILFGAVVKGNNRFVLGGSTIMFSDLPATELSSSWFDTADNKLFFNGLINWALNFNIDEIPGNPSLDSILFISIFSGILGISLIVLGFFAIFTGKEIKLFDIDAKYVKSTQDNADQLNKSPLSKSQKKLQQRMKQNK